MEKKKHFIITGAGLAGLSAAYEIAKTGARVTVLEARDRVGGRVITRHLDGKPVDFGGFIVYPWYTEYHRLIAEIGIETKLEDIPQGIIYYEVDDTGRLYIKDEIPFSAMHAARVGLSVAPGMIRSHSVSVPSLDAFGRRTVSEVLRGALGHPEQETLYERYSDIVAQGYCYPPATEFKMAFMAPLIYMSRFHGDVSQGYFIRSGNEQLPEVLATEIARMGGEIILNTHVTGITETTVHTSSGDYTGDSVIFTHNVDETYAAAVTAGAGLATPLKPIGYTRFFTIGVKCEGSIAIHDNPDWNGCFFAPDSNPKSPLQMISCTKGSVFDPSLKEWILANIIVRDGRTDTEITKEEIDRVIARDMKKYFPDAHVTETEPSEYWEQTMPAATEEFVEAARAAQGVNEHYYAGDFFGAPSMEAAFETGVYAARLATGQIKKKESVMDVIMDTVEKVVKSSKE